MFKTVKKIKTLKGEITIPADKSISHRAVMFSSIAKGRTLIKNFSTGADCISTMNLFKQLGVEISFTDNNLSVIGGGLTPNVNPLNCGNSGTTMRLVSGILAGQNFDSVLVGDTSLSKRPMKRIIEPLSLMGADIVSVDGHAPLVIKGRELVAIDYVSKLASAQVKSSVLLAALKADGTTKYTEPYLSRNHTEIMLKYLGAQIETDNNVIKISPSELSANDIEVVGDISSAAFFIVAGLIIEGADLLIKNVGLNKTRTGIIDVVNRMGGDISVLNERVVSGEDVADIRVKYTESLKACEIRGADIPRLIDELPVIAVLASQAEGQTVVKDASDLRNKEADRISCLVNEFKKIGMDINESEDGFSINGKNKLLGNAKLQVYNDHRLAMSFYIAGLICENEIAIDGFEWTKISFPKFEEFFFELQR